MITNYKICHNSPSLDSPKSERTSGGKRTKPSTNSQYDLPYAKAALQVLGMVDVAGGMVPWCISPGQIKTANGLSHACLDSIHAAGV
ncbi:uncharacterized protein MYCFIDRAFT_209833 [Pseudocercospora fijiensis CIRAD86]|uniref:Uncharacterized protein n=1 Tax=Pseudocercospora fijiensis (strain CIRAD86) TaxID=383855 RepID=N1Q9N3_PSEFD|nr:uncharacterized protein MYCFIDRAFT_209833 [Pseudocercospora fijiensis CIRAD86]EME88511.1 hypothetical protein MYCFIDRAFT_209833 [Pseudocercospora fijiensis CIRAD86]